MLVVAGLVVVLRLEIRKTAHLLYFLCGDVLDLPGDAVFLSAD